jgi:hypothetical protein
VADGRDAILFAPSLPLRPLHPAEADGDGVANAATTQEIVTLSKVLCQVLGHAAGTGIGERDRVTCREAARCAGAQLAEVASVARKVAGQCSELALPAPANAVGDPRERRRLTAACQWLWALDTSVHAAQHRDPMAADDRDLLSAIPVNSLPVRRMLPQEDEPVAALCEGAIISAERVRHMAWRAGSLESWLSV